jgi:hypothetical protein
MAPVLSSSTEPERFSSFDVEFFSEAAAIQWGFLHIVNSEVHSNETVSL